MFKELSAMKNILIKNIGLFLWAIAFSVVAQHKTVQKLSESDIPTSEALPAGMELVWNDEFNGQRLDPEKWADTYFSSLDYLKENSRRALEERKLPKADYIFTGKTIVLKATDKLYPGADRQISSIQTYDWETNTNRMDNALGGFFEARIRRDAGKDAKKVNVAFWFDSPGPDLKYYLEKGGHAFGMNGIRPRGQLFEIDMCEYLSTEIVLHGNVAPDGKFERNIGHYIHNGDFKGKWVTHSLLWTPAGLKFYIDGVLVKEWWNPRDIKSPNHAMNLFLGAYGVGGVTMEVDYIRYYQWALDKNNCLPNSGFEYSKEIFPWEGTGQIDRLNARSGKNALRLCPGTHIEQYVYLDHSKTYLLDFWSKGKGDLQVSIDNITQVSGISEDKVESKHAVNRRYTRRKIKFQTNSEFADHKRTVKLSFKNGGQEDIFIDDIVISEVTK